MMVIITYDVETQTPAGRKRLRLVAKECKNYGVRVQNSVFECVLDNALFIKLRGILDNIIDKEKDSIRFYFMGNKWDHHIETIGIKIGINVDSVLIL
ncbi:MAG: CRISPR-associated endonuclease Cas2 [Bacteroidaceae bacterium]|nr:CRISPR-associated endonuclease Cas2 [Bacteroidaceae bacterium]